jgi:hypothetical protein
LGARLNRIASCAPIAASLVCVLLFLKVNADAQPATLNLSQDLVALGIAATNMVPNQPSLDAGPLFRAGVAYAMTHQLGRVIADKGSYYFLSLQNPIAHVQLGGNSETPDVHDLTIDFQGSDLIFTHTLQTGIWLWYDTNVVLENFTADYQPLPFTQVRVTSVDTANAKFQYSVQPGWVDPSTFNSAQPSPGTGPVGIEVHLFRSGREAFGTRRMAAQFPFSGSDVTIVSGNGFDPTPQNMATIRPGDIAVIAMRQFGEPLTAVHCTGCTFRNLTFYSAAGAALDGTYLENTVWERVYSVPKPGTDRLISTFGFGFQARGPNNQVRLSRAIRTLDGGFALYVWATGEVESRPSARSVIVAGATGSLGQGQTIANLSSVVFQRRSDGVILASAVMVSQTGTLGVYNPDHLTYTFDRDLPTNLAGAVMYTTDNSQRGGNSLIERNNIQEKPCCYGMDIWGWAGSTVRGNYIRRVGYAGIGGIHNLWPGTWTTPPLVDMTIRNNVIDGTNIAPDFWLNEMGGIQMEATRQLSNGDFDPMAISAHQNINIIDNFIADPGRSAVWLANTSPGNVSGNIFSHSNERLQLSHPPQTDVIAPLVVDTTSSGISASDNSVDSTSGVMFVTDTQYRQLAAYAPGATLRLNAYNLGALSSPSITLKDADGNTSSVSIQNTAAHALDVQLPAAAALGGAFLTLTSGGAKYFGTLFIDSQDNIPALNGCTYEASASSTSAPNAGGGLPILVITQAGCSYSAVASNPFVTTGGDGTGTAVMSVGLAANSGAARTATVEIAGIPVTLNQAAVVTPVSVTPSSGVGLNQTFSALYSDLNGFADIGTAMLNVNTSSNLAGGCAVEYVRASNQMFLRNDAGTAWMGPGTAGTAGVLQNSQCTLNLQASSTAPSGTNLTVNYAVSFKTSFFGPKSIFMNAANASVTSGWLSTGTWTVGPKRPSGQLTSQ